MTTQDLQTLSSTYAHIALQERLANLQAYSMSSLLNNTTPLSIATRINEQYLARVNACGTCLIKLYERPNLADYIKNKCITLLHEESEVKNAKNDVVYEFFLKSYNDTEKENLSREKFQLSQELKEQFALHKDFLKNYDEEQQEEIFEELCMAAELFVNEYLKIKTSYHYPVTEENYLDALLYGKFDKIQ